MGLTWKASPAPVDAQMPGFAYWLTRMCQISASHMCGHTLERVQAMQAPSQVRY